MHCAVHLAGMKGPFLAAGEPGHFGMRVIEEADEPILQLKTTNGTTIARITLTKFLKAVRSRGKRGKLQAEKNHTAMESRIYSIRIFCTSARRGKLIFFHQMA